MEGSAPEPPEILGCTCRRLRMATRRISQLYDRELQAIGLTITQYSLLANLKRNDGIGLGPFAELLVMDPTTLTRNLKPLVRDKLVVMAPDPQDRRARVLHLTERGRTALAKAVPAWTKAQRRIEAAFGRTDTAQLHASLDRLLDRIAT